MSEDLPRYGQRIFCIDLPGPYGPVEELFAWRDKLATMPDGDPTVIWSRRTIEDYIREHKRRAH